MTLSCSKKCDEAIKLMKGKALRKHSLHEKTAASVITNIVSTAIMKTIPLIYETVLFTKSDMPSLNVIH